MQMKSLLKKAGLAVVAKEAIERVNEARKPKPSLWSRMAKPLALLGAGGAAIWAYRSGKLEPVIDKVSGSSGSDSHSTTTFANSAVPAAATGTTTTGEASTSTTL